MFNFTFYSIGFTKKPQLDFNGNFLNENFKQIDAVVHLASLFEGKSLSINDIVKGEKNYENNIWKHICISIPEGEAVQSDGSVDFVYRTYNKVFLLRINMKQMVSIVKEDEENTNDIPEYVGDKIPSLPFFFCILDLRNSDHPIMAIQKSSIWHYKIDRTKAFMEELLSKLLDNDCGLTITLTEKTRDIDFFDYVRERMHAKKDPLLNMSLTVYNPKANGVKIRNDMPTYIKSVVDMIEENNLPNSSLDIDVSNSPTVDEIQKKKVVQEMLNASKDNDFQLVASFKSKTKCIYGDSIRITVGMQENLIDKYKKGETVYVMNDSESKEHPLIMWLDNTINDNKLFEDEKKIHQPRDNRRK